MSQVNSWKAYFQTHSGNEDANKNVSAFAEDSIVDPTNPDIFGAKILSAILSDIDAVVIAKSPTSNDLRLYHGFTNLGGDPSSP